MVKGHGVTQGMLSPPRLSMNLGRKSIFGGGGGDSAATPGHAADTGHFIVQPTGGFSHQRRCSSLLLCPTAASLDWAGQYSPIELADLTTPKSYGHQCVDCGQF